MRRAFGKKNNKHLIEMYWQKFYKGARSKGVPKQTIKKIFGKINGHYMFPESHSYAFAISAYQAAWLKCYYPTEFFVQLMNCQPMGFYPLEALKEDARRFGVPFLNPSINRSSVRCTAEEHSVRLGLEFVKNVGPESARAIVEERKRKGAYPGVRDLVQRVSLKPETVGSLVMAGAFDSLMTSRRLALWEARLYFGPRAYQQVLPISFDHDVPKLHDFTPYEKMLGEYDVMGIYPGGHLMEFLRPKLPQEVVTAQVAEKAGEGTAVTVAGWPVARQHPRGENGTVFVPIEDETGDLQLILWPGVFQKHRREMNSHVLMARGTISRWDGTANLVVSHVQRVPLPLEMPKTHDWH